MDLEGSAGKASENHKFLYHSFTFESQSSFQVEIFGLVPGLQIWREIFREAGNPALTLNEMSLCFVQAPRLF